MKNQKAQKAKLGKRRKGDWVLAQSLPRMNAWVGALAATLSLFASSASYAGDAVLAYYSSTKSVQEREGVLKPEFSKAGLELTIFAKFKEFQEEVKTKNPSFVLAPSEYQQFNPEYEPVMRFKKDASDSFKYKFYALEEAAAGMDLTKAKAGMVEIVDRENLKDLLQKITGKAPKGLKSVTKPEDLFPLLVFKSADVIMVAPDDYDSLKEKFTTKVAAIAESSEVAYPQLYVKKGTDAKKVVEALKAFDTEKLKKLGFTQISEVAGGAK